MRVLTWKMERSYKTNIDSIRIYIILDAGVPMLKKKLLEHGCQPILYRFMEAMTKDMATEQYNVDQYLHDSNRP